MRMSCCKDTCNDTCAEFSSVSCHHMSAVHRFHAYNEWQSAEFNTDRMQAWMCTFLLQASDHQCKRHSWSVSESQHIQTDCIKASQTWTEILWSQWTIWESVDVEWKRLDTTSCLFTTDQLHQLWIFVLFWTESDWITSVSSSDLRSTSIWMHCMIDA